MRNYIVRLIEKDSGPQGTQLMKGFHSAVKDCDGVQVKHNLIAAANMLVVGIRDDETLNNIKKRHGKGVDIVQQDFSPARKMHLS